MTSSERYDLHNYRNTAEGLELSDSVGGIINDLLFPRAGVTTNRDTAFNNITNILTDGGLEGLAANDFVLNELERRAGSEIMNLPDVGHLISRTYETFVPKELQNKLEGSNGYMSQGVKLALFAAQMNGTLTEAQAQIGSNVVTAFGPGANQIDLTSNSDMGIVQRMFADPMHYNAAVYGSPLTSTSANQDVVSDYLKNELGQSEEQINQYYESQGLDPQYAETDAGVLKSIAGFAEAIGSGTVKTLKDINFQYKKYLGGDIAQNAIKLGIQSSSLGAISVGGMAIPVAFILYPMIKKLSDTLSPKDGQEVRDYLSQDQFLGLIDGIPDGQELTLQDLTILSGDVPDPVEGAANILDLVANPIKLVENLYDNVITPIPIVGDFLANPFGVFGPEDRQNPTPEEQAALDELYTQAAYNQLAEDALNATPEQLQEYLDRTSTVPKTYEELVNEIDNYYDEQFPETVNEQGLPTRVNGLGDNDINNDPSDYDPTALEELNQRENSIQDRRDALDRDQSMNFFDELDELLENVTDQEGYDAAYDSLNEKYARKHAALDAEQEEVDSLRGDIYNNEVETGQRNPDGSYYNPFESEEERNARLEAEYMADAQAGADAQNANGDWNNGGEGPSQSDIDAMLAAEAAAQAAAENNYYPPEDGREGESDFDANDFGSNIVDDGSGPRNEDGTPYNPFESPEEREARLEAEGMAQAMRDYTPDGEDGSQMIEDGMLPGESLDDYYLRTYRQGEDEDPGNYGDDGAGLDENGNYADGPVGPGLNDDDTWTPAYGDEWSEETPNRITMYNSDGEPYTAYANEDGARAQAGYEQGGTFDQDGNYTEPNYNGGVTNTQSTEPGSGFTNLPDDPSTRSNFNDTVVRHPSTVQDSSTNASNSDVASSRREREAAEDAENNNNNSGGGGGGGGGGGSSVSSGGGSSGGGGSSVNSGGGSVDQATIDAGLAAVDAAKNALANTNTNTNTSITDNGSGNEPVTPESDGNPFVTGPGTSSLGPTEQSVEINTGGTYDPNFIDQVILNASPENIPNGVIAPDGPMGFGTPERHYNPETGETFIAPSDKYTFEEGSGWISGTKQQYETSQGNYPEGVTRRTDTGPNGEPQQFPQMTVDYYNSITGESFTAPDGGFSADPDAGWFRGTRNDYNRSIAVPDPNNPFNTPGVGIDQLDPIIGTTTDTGTDTMGSFVDTMPKVVHNFEPLGVSPEQIQEFESRARQAYDTNSFSGLDAVHHGLAAYDAYEVAYSSSIQQGLTPQQAHLAGMQATESSYLPENLVRPPRVVQGSTDPASIAEAQAHFAGMADNASLIGAGIPTGPGAVNPGLIGAGTPLGPNLTDLDPSSRTMDAVPGAVNPNPDANLPIGGLPIIGAGPNPGVSDTTVAPGTPGYNENNLGLEDRFTTGGTNPGATSGEVQYGDEFDPTFGLLRVLYGDEVANRYRGGGLAQVDAQNLIDKYQRQVEGLAFDRTATLAGQDQELVNQLRQTQRDSDLGLLQNYGPSYAQALYNTDQVATNQLRQQNTMSNRLYDEAEGNFSDSRQAQITEDAFQTSALQGRERDPSMLYERLIGSEQARADREARAQVAGGNTFNMSRNFTQQIPGMILGGGYDASGNKTISPVYGAVDAVGAAQQNYSNTQNFLDNQRAQQAYQESINAAREANELSTLEKLENGFNTFKDGLQTASDAFTFIGGLGDSFQGIADSASGSSLPGAGVVSSVAGAAGGLLTGVGNLFGQDDTATTANTATQPVNTATQAVNTATTPANTSTFNTTPLPATTYDTSSTFNVDSFGTGLDLLQTGAGLFGGNVDTSGTGINYGENVIPSNPFATDTYGNITSGGGNPFATDLSGNLTNAGGNGLNQPYVTTPANTGSSGGGALSGLATLGSGALGLGADALGGAYNLGSDALGSAYGVGSNVVGGVVDVGADLLGAGYDVTSNVVETAVDVGSKVVEFTVDSIATIWGGLFG